MAYPFLRLITHPLAVIPHILGQPLRTLPGTLKQTGLGSGFRIDRRLTSELGGNLNHRLIDQDCDRIQITRVSLKPQTLGLQRQCPTTGKRIMKTRQPITIKQLIRLRMINVLRAGAMPAEPDLLASLLQ